MSSTTWEAGCDPLRNHPLHGSSPAARLLPWGVYLGGVLVERWATLGAAKEFARHRFGVTRWDRAAPGFYREHIDERKGES